MKWSAMDGPAGGRRAESPIALLPFRFAVEDIERSDPHRVRRGGPTSPGYFCLCSALARAEANIAIPALFERFPEMTLAVAREKIQPRGSFIMNTPATLPVRLTT